MAESTTLQTAREQQCRQNAQRKSERKRQAVLEAIVTLQQQDRLVTKTAIARQANVSYPFLAKHADLLQAIDNAAVAGNAKRLASAPAVRGQDVVVAAMQRQMEKLKQQVRKKESEIRRMQQEIDQLYGKLASRSELTDTQIRAKLKEALQRLQTYEKGLS